MANMSHCRFENTANDIKDCIDALDAADWDLDDLMKSAASEHEAKAMKRFVKLCKLVADGFDDE